MTHALFAGPDGAVFHESLSRCSNTIMNFNWRIDELMIGLINYLDQDHDHDHVLYHDHVLDHDHDVHGMDQDPEHDDDVLLSKGSERQTWFAPMIRD